MPPEADLNIYGATGLPVFSGRVYDEYLRELQGERGRRIYREMSDQDPVIGSGLLAIEMLARQVNWVVAPADKTSKAQEVADFVDGCFQDLQPSWADTLSEILTMLRFGWSWLEVLYKERNGLETEDPLHRSRFNDNKVGWRGWSTRSQETLYRWEWDPSGSGEVTALVQLPPPDYIFRTVPRNKSLHFRTRSIRGNPEGVSILRNAYRPWYMKKHIEAIEGIGVERDLAGLPVMWVPERLLMQSASDTDKTLLGQLQKIVTNIKRDEQEGVLMPLSFNNDGNPMYKLELLNSGGTRQFDTDKIIQRYDNRIAMTMLADFLLLGHEAVGSYALSSDKTELFALALGTILDAVALEISTHGIPTLVMVNGWPAELAPKFTHGDIKSVDIGKLGTYIQQLAGAGMVMFPNPELEKHLKEEAGLPAGKYLPPLPDSNPDKVTEEEDEDDAQAASEAFGETGDVVVLPSSNPAFERGSQYAATAGKPWYVLGRSGLVKSPPAGSLDPVMIGDLLSTEQNSLAKKAAAKLDAENDITGKTVEIHDSAVAQALKPYVESHGGKVTSPLDGLNMGEQIAWYDRRQQASETFHQAVAHHRHFGPKLTDRVNAVLDQPLIKGLSRDQYLTFLDATLRARSFRQLEPRWQRLVELAEKQLSDESVQAPRLSSAGTKASEIRRLRERGLAPAAIASALRIRPQQVRNVLSR